MSSTLLTGCCYFIVILNCRNCETGLMVFFAQVADNAGN